MKNNGTFNRPRARGTATANGIPFEIKLSPSQLGSEKQDSRPSYNGKRDNLLPIHNQNILAK